MFKTYAAVLGATTILASTALAAGGPITPGTYLVTQQYTGLIDPNGLCAGAGVAVGLTSTGVATVGGAGKTATGVQAVPVPQSPYGVSTLSCAYDAYPASISTTGPTPLPPNQTTTCTANGTTYTVVTAAPNQNPPGSGNFNSVVPKIQYKITTTNSAVEIGGTTICYVSTDTLYLRTGK